MSRFVKKKELFTISDRGNAGKIIFRDGATKEAKRTEFIHDFTIESFFTISFENSGHKLGLSKVTSSFLDLRKSKKLFNKERNHKFFFSKEGFDVEGISKIELCEFLRAERLSRSKVKHA